MFAHWLRTQELDTFLNNLESKTDAQLQELKVDIASVHRFTIGQHIANLDTDALRILNGLYDFIEKDENFGHSRRAVKCEDPRPTDWNPADRNGMLRVSVTGTDAHSSWMFGG